MATTKQINMRKAVLAYLKTNPERHNQSSWVYSNDIYSFNDIDVLEMREGMCNTTMCVAGTAVFLDALESNTPRIHILGDNGWTKKAASILGLDYDTAYHMFMNMNNTQVLEKLQELSLEEPNE